MAAQRLSCLVLLNESRRRYFAERFHNLHAKLNQTIGTDGVQDQAVAIAKLALADQMLEQALKLNSRESMPSRKP